MTVRTSKGRVAARNPLKERRDYRDEELYKKKERVEKSASLVSA
jgi:hypothetical protein